MPNATLTFVYALERGTPEPLTRHRTKDFGEAKPTRKFTAFIDNGLHSALDLTP